ncbi:MAG: hypothetical protein CFE43_18480 [Burkholderiales bacterium PBB3]|nr:MAG: hypothetical protein CFE43_18480 [Burkholderiales bacterium PBB3]
MTVSSLHSELATTPPGRTAHEQYGQSMRLARKLIAQTLSFFADREEDALEGLRAHVIALVDARPPLVQAQNLRSIYVLLGKFSAEFHQALQSALAEEISAALSLALPDPKKLGQRHGAGDTADVGLSLTLIDIGDVERILLLDRVAQRFCNRYEAGLGPLSQRLCFLFGKETMSGADNPFHPLVLLRSFVRAWEQCDLDAQATEDFAAALEPISFVDLAPLYEELNSTLAKAGLSGERSLVIRRAVGGAAGGAGAYAASQPAPLEASPHAASQSRPGPLAQGSSPAPLDGGGARSAWGALEPARRTVAAHARQFLQRIGLRPSQVSDPDSELATRPVFEAADAALMGFLDQPLSNWHDPSNPNVLRQMRDREEIRSAPELDRGTVDALAEVFDFVFADQAIPLQIKVIIGRLQVPVLKAAMIDRDFFLSDQHPARRLVDTLAGASVAWAPEKGESDPLYVRIESTVQRVLNEFEDDLELFSELLRDFTEFLFESEQQVQNRVEPTAQVEHKVESQEHARAQADELIHKHLSERDTSRPLGPFLLPFLTNQWRDVIAHAILAEVDSDATCQLALKTMDLLIWSTEPKTTSEQRRELVSVLPDLVRQINVGLDAIDWAGEPRSTFTRRLINTHTLAIRMKQPPAPDSQVAALESRQGEEAIKQLDERRAARQILDEDDAFDTAAQGFKRGMWFDLEIETGTRARCRLTWVSPLRTRLLFTNRDGFDAFVRSEREVAAMLRLGRLRVVDHEPIVGRALEQLLQAQDQAEDHELAVAA